MREQVLPDTYNRNTVFPATRIPFLLTTVLIASFAATVVVSSTVQRDLDSQWLASCPGDSASVALTLSDFLAARPTLAHYPNFRRAEHAITFFYRLCSNGAFLSATFGTILISDVFQPETPRNPSLSSPSLATPNYILDKRRKFPTPFIRLRHSTRFSAVLVDNVVNAIHIHSLPDQNAQGHFIASRTGVHDVFVDTRALSETCVSSSPSSCEPVSMRWTSLLSDSRDLIPVPPSVSTLRQTHRNTPATQRHAVAVHAPGNCAAVSPSCASGGAQRVLQVTLVADHFYCANVSLTSEKFKNYNGATIFGNMKSTFDKIAEIFVDQTCILLEAVNFVAYCNPKTTPFVPHFYGSELRLNFGNFWKTKYQSSNHAKILLTGSGLSEGKFAGSAGRGTVCQPENSFAWAIGSNALVVAHELGHIVGAFHDQADKTSLMFELTTKDTESRFSTNSLNQISGEIDCQKPKCMRVITPSPSPAAVACSQTTSDTEQFGCTFNNALGAIDASAGKIAIITSQNYGGFVVQGSTKDSRISQRRVAFMALIITPANGFIDEDTIVSSGTFKKFGVRGYQTGKIFMSTNDIIISPFYSTCCNQILYLYIKAGLYSTVTNNGVEDRKLFNATGKFQVRVACKNPCASDPDGTSVSASPGVSKCPACIPTTYTPMDNTRRSIFLQ